MTLITSRAKLKTLLDAGSQATSAALYGLTLELFTNDVDPTPDRVNADFDAATDVSGTLTFSWGAAAYNADGNAEIRGTPVNITATGPGFSTYYGYKLRTAGNVLVAAEKFAEGILPEFVGQVITVIPRYVLANP